MPYLAPIFTALGASATTATALSYATVIATTAYSANKMASAAKGPAMVQADPNTAQSAETAAPVTPTNSSVLATQQDMRRESLRRKGYLQTIYGGAGPRTSPNLTSTAQGATKLGA